MTKLKDYKGVSIYVNENGKFYCDVVGNSNDFSKKSFESEKLPSIEKAINDYKASAIENGRQFYKIQYPPYSLKLLTETHSIGNRIFFDDGSDSSKQSRLYPKDIDLTDDFKKMEKIIDEVTDINSKITELYKQQRELNDKLSNIYMKFKPIQL